jgi:CHAD domain-containing protein
LRKSQSRLRKSWRLARRERTGEALHRWRKRVKDQSAQLRLLRIVASHEAKARREIQKQVAEFLGEEHDLYLLAEQLSSAAIPPAAEPVRTRFLEAVKKRRKALRRRAFKAAEEACSEKPKAFAAQLTAGWAKAPEALGAGSISRSR